MHFGRLMAAVATTLIGAIPAFADGPVKARIGWVVVPADLSLAKDAATRLAEANH
jgi:hypothetical protein